MRLGLAWLVWHGLDMSNRIVWADVMAAKIAAADAEASSLRTSLAYHLQLKEEREARESERVWGDGDTFRDARGMWALAAFPRKGGE